MSVSGIDTLSWSSAAYSRRAARFPTVPEPQPDEELGRMQEWPLRSYLELRALPVSVRSARLHVRHLLREWRLEALTDTVELVVSEIITNAVRACAGIAAEGTVTGPARHAPWLRFWVTSDGQRVLTQVWDIEQRRPVCQDTGLDAEAGRGLLLVDALCARWGCYAPGPPGGKIVWAVCGP
jgi:anti-sigma regulatory factor (Ser/Thr protein kinase)